MINRAYHDSLFMARYRQRERVNISTFFSTMLYVPLFGVPSTMFLNMKILLFSSPFLSLKERKMIKFNDSKYQNMGIQVKKIFQGDNLGWELFAVIYCREVAEIPMIDWLIPESKSFTANLFLPTPKFLHKQYTTPNSHTNMKWILIEMLYYELPILLLLFTSHT